MAQVPPSNFRSVLSNHPARVYVNADKVHYSASARSICIHSEHFSAQPESERYLELVATGDRSYYGMGYILMEPAWPINDLSATLCENPSFSPISIRSVEVGGQSYRLNSRDQIPDSILKFCAGSLDKRYIGNHYWVDPKDFYVTVEGELWLDGQAQVSVHYIHGHWPMELDGKANKIVRVPKDTILSPSATVNSDIPDRNLYLTEKVLLRPVSNFERYQANAIANSPVPSSF